MESDTCSGKTNTDCDGPYQEPAFVSLPGSIGNYKSVSRQGIQRIPAESGVNFWYGLARRDLNLSASIGHQ